VLAGASLQRHRVVAAVAELPEQLVVFVHRGRQTSWRMERDEDAGGVDAVPDPVSASIS
jgi:hypothetical protein